MKQTEEKILLKNSIITPDGTELTSNHVYDYKSYKDANGEVYMNDGGREYIRRSVNKEPYIDNCIYSTDSFERIRSELSWGTYGKKGTEELHYIKFKDMSNAHIEAITTNFVEGLFINILKEELKYRELNNIFVEDN